MNPLARNKNIVIQQADSDLLVYDLNTDKAICLNETSALIWQNCDGKKNMLEIAKVVEKKFGELVSEDFVKFAIDQLKKENLIENKNEIVTEFNGMSRRDVIKRIGLTSLVALPLVASLTAPPAAQALSVVACINVGGLLVGAVVNAASPSAVQCRNALNAQCCANAVTAFVFTPLTNTCVGVCAL